MRREYAYVGQVAYEQQTRGDKLHSGCEDDHGEAVACAVDEDAGPDLRDDGHGLDPERVRVDGGLREALFVVLEPKEEHALEGEGFEHGADDGESGEDVSEWS
jgi:hypothetical protein